MKHDWEYKKLGEVAEIIGGSTPKTNIKEYWDGDYFWITPAELKGDRFIKSTSRTITDLAVENTNLSLLPKGTVLLSSRAPIGKVAIADVPMYCNQGFKNIICGEKLNNNYVYWLLYGKTEYLNSLGVGATFKEISKKIVENIPIPLPPLSTQQSIVSELDSLSKIIADCKETLKDYDALEQSIFYDMFGDPVKNDKGWEVKKLGEIGFCCSGGTPSRSNPEYFNGDIMWYSAGELNEMYLGDSVEKITETALNNCSAKICKAGSLFVGMYDTAAFKLGIAKVDSCSNQACANIQLYEDNIIWLYFTLLMMKEEALKNRHGARQKNLNLGYIKNFDIPLPPLPLQQDFATKIEAIEQMKAETRDALQEAETLFQARMDYWFN